RGPFDDVYQGGTSQIIVTNGAGALRSDDGGATWTFTQFTGLCDTFGCIVFIRISFLSATEWWAAGQRRGRSFYGSIHHTLNGGAAWSSSLAYGLFCNQVFFSSASTGTAVGHFYGDMMRTTDRGAHWTRQSGPPAVLNSVSFIDDNIGIVAGAYETIARTTTGGEEASRTIRIST